MAMFEVHYRIRSTGRKSWMLIEATSHGNAQDVFEAMDYANDFCVVCVVYANQERA